MLRFLLVLGLAAAFESNFQYGCQDSHCSFQLVVPKEVAQYIDEQQLIGVVSQINDNLLTLNTTANDETASTSLANFTTIFNAKIQPINNQSDSLTPLISSTVDNSTNLLSDAINAQQTSRQLYTAMKCFQDGVRPSEECFQQATTTLAPTTVAATTTATFDGSTVVSTTGAPSNLSTVVPVTGAISSVATAAPTTATTVAATTTATSDGSTVVSTTGAPSNLSTVVPVTGATSSVATAAPTTATNTSTPTEGTATPSTPTASTAAPSTGAPSDGTTAASTADPTVAPVTSVPTTGAPVTEKKT